MFITYTSHLAIWCYQQVFDAHNCRDGMCWDWLKTATGFTLWLEGIGSLCGPADLQVMTEQSLHTYAFFLHLQMLACQGLTPGHLIQ